MTGNYLKGNLLEVFIIVRQYRMLTTSVKLTHLIDLTGISPCGILCYEIKGLTLFCEMWIKYYYLCVH